MVATRKASNMCSNVTNKSSMLKVGCKNCAVDEISVWYAEHFVSLVVNGCNVDVRKRVNQIVWCLKSHLELYKPTKT